GGLERPGEPLHEVLVGCGARWRGRFPLFRWRVLVLQGGPGPLERAGHRLLARTEDAGHLTGMEPEHVAQDQYGALAGWQQLKGLDKRQRDRLPGLVEGFRTGRAVGGPLDP